MEIQAWTILALVSGFVALAVLVTLILFLMRQRRKAPKTAIEVKEERLRLAERRVQYGKCAYDVPFTPDFQLGAQSVTWQKAMREVGQALFRHKVTAVGLLHGTYVGTDPVGFLTFLRQQQIPGVTRLIDRLQPLIKTGIDRVTRDLGNFCEPYRKLLQESLGNHLVVETVHWPSGNYHVARLKGALATLNWIDDRLGVLPSTQNRILLLGHSHAGQVFALLSRILHDEKDREKILEVAASVLPHDNMKDVRAKIERVRRAKLDFVTLGTPPVYSWSASSQGHVLNIINHRGDRPVGGSLLGVLHTKTGDYVQQLAITGTDSLAFSRAERHGNLVLDELLGKGITVSSYMHFAREQRRLHEVGVTHLLDFGDASNLFPNAIQTFFGHGVYTKGSAMLEVWRVIVAEFYS